MFAPNHPQAAAELTRVCRPGGKIGLATWTPDGFIGELLKVVGRARAAPARRRLPDPLGDGAVPQGAVRRRRSTLSPARSGRSRAAFRSAEAFVDLFRTYYGPTLKAFEAVGDTGADALYADLVDLVGRYAGTSNGP